MSSDSEYDTTLQVLRTKRDRLRTELSSVVAAIAALEEAVSVGSANKASDGSEVNFDGLTQPEMAAETLRIKGKPLTSREALDFWIDHSRAPAGSSPEQQVQVAFRNRAKSTGDVVHVGDGKWGLREWFSKSELRDIQSKADMIDAGRARDKKEHIAKTVEGIRKSQAKGVYHGAPPKLTPSQWALAVEMAEKGESLREIHRQIAETGSAGGTSGFLNLNLVRHGRKIREVILMWTHRLTVGLDVMPA